MEMPGLGSGSGFSKENTVVETASLSSPPVLPPAEIILQSSKTSESADAAALDPDLLLSMHPDPYRVFHRPNSATIGRYRTASTINPPFGMVGLTGSSCDRDKPQMPIDCGKSKPEACVGGGSSCSGAGSRNVNLKCTEVDLSRFGFGEGEKKKFCMRDSGYGMVYY